MWDVSIIIFSLCTIVFLFCQWQFTSNFSSNLQGWDDFSGPYSIFFSQISKEQGPWCEYQGSVVWLFLYPRLICPSPTVDLLYSHLRDILSASMAGHLENSYDIPAESITITAPRRELLWSSSPLSHTGWVSLWVFQPSCSCSTWYVFQHSFWNTPIAWGSAGFRLKPGASAVPPKSTASFARSWTVT